MTDDPAYPAALAAALAALQARLGPGYALLGVHTEYSPSEVIGGADVLVLSVTVRPESPGARVRPRSGDREEANP